MGTWAGGVLSLSPALGTAQLGPSCSCAPPHGVTSPQRQALRHLWGQGEVPTQSLHPPFLDHALWVPGTCEFLPKWPFRGLRGSLL